MLKFCRHKFYLCFGTLKVKMTRAMNGLEMSICYQLKNVKFLAAKNLVGVDKLSLKKGSGL